MNHADHVNLLREGVSSTGGVWADLGSGTGAFTLALAELIRTTEGEGATLYSVDRDGGALREQGRLMFARFPTVRAHFLTQDFTQPLILPLLDGLVMANSLHFIRHDQQLPLLRRLRELLKPGGRFLLVEYNTDQGNQWVPYPLSDGKWAALATAAGFASTRLLSRRPSRFLGEIYSALSVNA